MIRYLQVLSFSHQGALAGTISSLVMIFWMMIGQTFMQLHRTKLPTDVSRCNVMYDNVTSIYTTTTPISNPSTLEDIMEEQKPLYVYTRPSTL